MAEEERASETSITDERQELMIDPTSSQINQNQFIKTAHFLKPTLPPNFLPPNTSKFQPFSLPRTPDVTFNGSTQPIQGYITWVNNLEKTHGNLWQKVGIFDAIKCSTYHISKHSDLIFHLVENWCPETNTFVFPWGEVSVTLEDVFVLGGFSPLGVCVLDKCCCVLGENVKKIEFIENKLIMCHRELMKIDRNLSHLRWQEYFIGCGGEIECAGFLALWLARHVFPARTTAVVTQSVFGIAARLTCGVKYAFGPAVLASIYRDLTMLKSRNVDCECGQCYGCCYLKLDSPIHLLQVWAWERILLLGPVPKTIKYGETRLARWESFTRKIYNEIDVEMVLDSCRETFSWRPYVLSLENLSLPRFYVDLGTWVVVDSDEELKLFAKCLMVSKLVGLNCVQEYNPHRVALQFGYDQDIPVSIDRCKASCELARAEVMENLEGMKLYLPPRLHEGDVTFRYHNWWRTGFNLVDKTLVGCTTKKRTVKRMKKMSKICENPMEKLSPSDELLSRNLLGVDNDPRVTRVSHMKIGANSQENTSMEEGAEVRTYCDSDNEALNVAKPLVDHGIISHSMGELGKTSNDTTSQTEPRTGTEPLVELEIDLISKGRVEGCGVINNLCISAPCNEVMVTSPLRKQEEGSGICQHDAPEENNEQNSIETSHEHNETLINVADKMFADDEPGEALRHNINMIHGTVMDDNLVLLSNEENDCELNPLAALCLEFESRISCLEKEFSALTAANVTSIRE